MCGRARTRERLSIDLNGSRASLEMMTNSTKNQISLTTVPDSKPTPEIQSLEPSPFLKTALDATSPLVSRDIETLFVTTLMISCVPTKPPPNRMMMRTSSSTDKMKWLGPNSMKFFALVSQASMNRFGLRVKNRVEHNKIVLLTIIKARLNHLNQNNLMK